MNQIELKDVVPSYFEAERTDHKSDVWRVALTINRGESYLIQASSGRGKSSFCSFIYGLRKEYHGSIRFNGTDISTLNTSQWVELRRTSISLLFQELRLFSELTALENIELKNRLTGFKSRADILAMLEMVGMGSKTDQVAGRLSLGEQQRVAFIRSLCQPFEIILLDEPVSHLDLSNGEVIAELLRHEAEKQGATTIITSVGNDLPMQYDNLLCL